MTRESSTQFLKKRHPVIKAVLDYALKRLELIVGMAIVAGIGAVSQHHSTAKIKSDPSYLGTTWVGTNLMDSHLEIYQNRDTLMVLSNRLAKIEHKK